MATKMDSKLRLGKTSAQLFMAKIYPGCKAIMGMECILFLDRQDVVGEYFIPDNVLSYNHGTTEAASARKRLQVTVATVKGDMSYTWYKVTKKMLGIELRGKPRDFRPGDVIGLRPSTNGKSTRLVVRNALNVVMSPTAEQVAYILKRVEPLIGGPVGATKVGHVVAPKVGIKDRRINEELDLIKSILQHGGPNSVTDLKIKDKRLYFKYNGRPFGVVSDPS